MSSKLVFTPPEGAALQDFAITVCKGYPTMKEWRMDQDTYKSMDRVEPKDGVYLIEEPGIYGFLTERDGWYCTYQMFHVSKQEIEAGADKNLLVDTDTIVGLGHEAANPNPKGAPAGFKQALDSVVFQYPDYINQYFDAEKIKGYRRPNTPYFTNPRHKHQLTRQAEMMEFLHKCEEDCSYAKLFNIGFSEHFHYVTPMMIFTTEDLTCCEDYLQAAEKVKANGKLNIWIQCQIHAGEVSAGEGGLAVIEDLCTEYGKKAIEDANIMVVPRINVDGAYLQWSGDFNGVNMNRDSTGVKSSQTRTLHKALMAFNPEVVGDGHEIVWYGKSDDNLFMNETEDYQVSPATAFSIDPHVVELAWEVTNNMMQVGIDRGLRPNHYQSGIALNNTIGRAYNGLLQAISILLEIRGIGGGGNCFDRRVFACKNAFLGMIDKAIELKDDIKASCARARAEMIAAGEVYDENRMISLHQVISGEKKAGLDVSHMRASLFPGVEPIWEHKQESVNDILARGRAFPTAYLLPCDMENINEALYIFDSNGIKFRRLPAGTAVKCGQYFYEGEYKYKDEVKGITARVEEEKEVVFEKGAYLIPLNQLTANIIAVTLEPDVNDSYGFDGTLEQSGVVTHDEKTGAYPIYRFTGCVKEL